MSSNSTSVPMLPENERFDGTKFPTWETKMLAHAKVRGLGGYLDGTIPKPTTPIAPTGAAVDEEDIPLPLSPLTTSVFSKTPSLEEWIHRDGMATSILVLNVKDPVGLGLKTDGTAHEAWKSLKDVYGRVTDLGLSRAMRELNTTTSTTGTPMVEHAATMRRLWRHANDMGARIADPMFRTIFINSLNEDWRHVVPVLRTFTTSAEVINFILEEDESNSKANPVVPTTALNTNTYAATREARRAARRNLVCTNPTCGAEGKRGHTIDECFWPGGGKAGQFPSWWRGKRPASNTTANVTQTYSFAAWTVPAADVSVYDEGGMQNVQFHGESILASPAALMEWTEATEAVAEVNIGAYQDSHGGVSSLERSTLTSSFELISGASDMSSFDFADLSDDDPADDAVFTVATNSAPVNALRANTHGHTVVILDTGCTDHCFINRDDFESYQSITDREGSGVEGSKFRIIGSGTVRRAVEQGGVRRIFEIEAIHTPELTCDILSISKLDAKGFASTFSGGKAYIRDPAGVVLIEAKLVNGMYLAELSAVTVNAMTARSRNVPVDKCTWHRRFGHIGMSGLDAVIRDERVEGLNLAESVDAGLCEDCLAGKQTRRPFDGETGVGGKRWVFHIMDGHIAGPKVQFLAHKSADESLDAFIAYAAEFERATGKKIKVVRIDNGGEWINKKWETHFKTQGIVLENTTPHSSSQNGPAERGIRTTIELARCLLADSGLPKSFWPLAVQCAAYLQWFHPKTRTGGVTPVIPAPAKLSPRTVKAVMVGYNNTAGYHLWDPQVRRFFFARDVVFEEGAGHWSRSPAGGDVDGAGEIEVEVESEPAVPASHVPIDSDLSVTDSSSGPDETVPGAVSVPNTPAVTTVAPLRRSERSRILTQALQDSRESQAAEAAAKAAREPWAVGTVPKYKKTSRAHVAFNISSAPVPQNFREAMEHSELWMEPMQKEYASLVGRETWELVDAPPGANIVACKWVYAVKYDTEGEIIKRKARLVAKGFQQIAGVDFFETYAGVVRYESLRMLWAICVEKGWVMWGMDVVSAYLNAAMKEKVYMHQPEGFVVPGQENKVWNNWAAEYNEKMASLDWVRSRADPAIRIRTTAMGTSITGTYTDDINGISSSNAAADDARAGIRSTYDVTDVPHTSTSLGMAIEYDPAAGTLSISSKAYLQRVLERYGMADCNPKSTPLAIGSQIIPSTEPLSPADRTFMADKPYREATGSLQHAANTTRPDLAFSVGRLATCLENPQPEHWKAVQHLLAYVKGTLDYKITYRRGGGSGIKPVGWVDADYAADLATRRSTSGEVFMMAGGPVSWSSKKQNAVALSTVEAEYIALTRASKQAMWMYSFLSELDMPQERPAILHGDNMGAAALAKDARGHARVKHIDIREHYIRERVADGDIEVVHVESANNLADLFTKVLPRDAHLALVRALGLTD
ncbi:Retrovirus-related pol polyprotein [Mycena sanguinolenta]|uniref:Retrovirus-related pol polyprotein n=1 Tax=Mycena sanguinolenta TaxID=230812 RepID=A0A8H6YJ65_9AGAR|nr:Retrovirus-related pol polyprotein [Mycena sanguinolenta]